MSREELPEKGTQVESSLRLGSWIKYRIEQTKERSAGHQYSSPLSSRPVRMWASSRTFPPPRPRATLLSGLLHRDGLLSIHSMNPNRPFLHYLASCQVWSQQWEEPRMHSLVPLGLSVKESQSLWPASSSTSSGSALSLPHWGPFWSFLLITEYSSDSLAYNLGFPIIFQSYTYLHARDTEVSFALCRCESILCTATTLSSHTLFSLLQHTSLGNLNT